MFIYIGDVRATKSVGTRFSAGSTAAAWQIAQRKLEMMQEHALAIGKEEQLAEGLSSDKSGREIFLSTCTEFQGAVHKLTTSSFLRSLEQAV